MTKKQNEINNKVNYSKLKKKTVSYSLQKQKIKIKLNKLQKIQLISKIGCVKYMITTKRIEILANFIEENRTVSIQEIVDKLNISAVTARKDVEYLEEHTPNIKKVRGGAVWQENESVTIRKNGNTSKDYLNNRFLKQSMTNQNNKKQIALTASSLLRNGDSILIDAGSTMYEFAKSISPNITITAFITAMNIAEVLEGMENITKIILGGVFRSKTTTMVSSMMEQIISTIFVDKLFIAASGLSYSHGFTCNDILEADVKKQLLKSAKEVYWLVDSSKIEKISSFQIAQFDSSHTIITDDKIDPENQKQLEKMMNVLIA
ncbi:DeoR/GlpR family DNA-binding transcription regulator [Metabacillus rhizolycopersici]|uniref:DeoR/GlpR family DNA-binding transcription regulator n=1 Tax=Metabacillus rhizolycopersici TaxID=2875709 RepID=A0ABS7UWU3_9BACI|nr:DeoR/GlpR family DNA-binding transcription regulator [Metabacillus rhizolycopersici]MBZ5752504.1 DeoR/GlpR family DNA-binding transcription regulator [Metabacillus rhizolycopersici]